MSGTLPASPAPSELEIRDYQPTLVSTAHSLKRLARSRGGQRWLLNVGWPSMSRAQFDPLWAFLVAQRGQYEAFSFVPPRISRSKGALGGTATVATSALGSSAVTVSGASPNVTGWAKAGDYLKFSNHDKVYVLTADVSTNGSGGASVYFWPGLLTDTVGATLVLTDVAWRVARTEDQLVTLMTEGGRHSLAVSLVEVP
jgi:hypothetical protein